MYPELTDAQKQQIMAWLVERRRDCGWTVARLDKSTAVFGKSQRPDQ